MKIPTSKLKLGVVVLLAASATIAEAQKQWTAGGASQNWSDGGNWSDVTAPGPGDILYFEDLLFTTGYTNRAAAVNNIVATNTTVAAINYTASSATTNFHFYTTLIPGGVTLTLSGLNSASSAALAVGDVPGTFGWSGSGSATNHTMITGVGTLAINDPISLMSVGWRNGATLDLSGLSTFNSTNGQIWVGTSSDNPNTTGPTGRLLLAKTNNITTAPNLAAPGTLIGFSPNANGSGTLLLGQVNNFNMDSLVVGGRRSTSTTLLAFAPAYTNSPTTGGFKLRGSAGGSTPASVFSIGDGAANPDGFNTPFTGTTVGAFSSADFSGASVDILADSIIIGRDTAVAALASGTATGTLIVEHGTITATNVFMSYKQPGSTNASGGSGIFIIKGDAVVNVVSNFALSYRTNNGNGFASPSPLLIVSNTAVVNVGGNISAVNTAGSWTPAIVSLGGGTINMTGKGKVDAPTLVGFGSINNASSITVTSSFAVNNDVAVGTLNLSSNLTLGSVVKLTFNLGTNNTVGGGINDYLNVGNNVTFNANPLITTFGGPLISGATYSLINYGGTQTGSVLWTNSTRSPIGLVQGAGQVALVVTNFAPATLTWKGSTSVTNWATTNVVWNNNTEKFFALDNVIFDDSCVATNVVIVGTVTPGSITFNNSLSNYVVNGGFIGGYTDFNMNGTASVSLSMSGSANQFTGPVNINAGTLRITSSGGSGNDSGGLLGGINSIAPITIADGATIEIVGNTSLGSSGNGVGRPLNIAGTGSAGLGALLATTGPAGPNVNTRKLTLTANATVGYTNAGTGSFSLNGITAPYLYPLDLAGFTLTTAGPGPVRLNQYVITNSGSIVVGGAFLGLNSCIIDGPGTINLGSKYLNFYAGFTTGYLAKAISVVNGGITAGTATAATIPLLSPISISSGGSLSITNSQPILSSGIISGTSAALLKYGPSNLMLNAANTYSGNTVVNAGSLSLGAAGSIANSSVIQIAPGTVLDVTAKAGTFALSTAQTLSLNGSVLGSVTVGNASTLLGNGVINGSLTVAAGGGVTAGGTNVTGILGVSSNLVLNGGYFNCDITPSFDTSDQINVGGNLTLSGVNTFKVDSIGGFDPSGTNTLITYAGTLTGGLANLTVVNPDVRYVVTFVDPATTPGKIQVVLTAPPAGLVWKGSSSVNPTWWDLKITTNWLNGVTPDIFWSADYVTFDDSASTNIVDLRGTTIGPGNISMNSANNFLFRGSAGLITSSLTNYGAGNLIISNTAINQFVGSGISVGAGLGNVTFIQPTNATLVTTLVGDGAVVKAGNSNLLVIGNSSGFAGNLNVNAGSVTAGSSNALGGTVNVASGASLELNGQLIPAAAVVVAGTGVNGGGAINNRSILGRTNFNLSTVTLAGNTTFGAISNAWGIQSALNGGGFTLTKTNSNDVWIQTTTETDLGNVDIVQGRLLFARAGTTLGRSESNVVVRTGATLGFAVSNNMSGFTADFPGGFDAGSKVVILSSNAAIESVGYGANLTSTNTFWGPIYLATNAPGIFNLDSNSKLVLNGPILGTNSTMIVTNNGSIVLNGTNTFGTNLFVRSGTLVLPHALAIASNSLVLLSNTVPTGNPSLTLANDSVFSTNSTLRIYTVNVGVSVGGDGTWLGPILVGGGNSLSLGGGEGGLNLLGVITNAGLTGPVSIEGSKTHIRGALAVTNSVSIGSSSGLGAGFNERFTTVTLDGKNFWTNTFVGRGRVNLGTNDALPVNAPVRVGVLSAGVGDRRIYFDLGGFNQTFIGFTETAVGDSLVVLGNSSTNSNSVLTLAGLPGETNTTAWYLMDVMDTPATPHLVSLNVTSGLWVFQNTNSFTGPTAISGGSLLLNKGSGISAGRVGQLSTSAVSVSGSGTLGGNGYIGGPVIVNSGGTLSAGVSPKAVGALTIENTLTLNAGSTSVFDFNLNTGTNDQVVGLSSLTYGGTLVITNLGTQPITNGTILPLFSSASYTAGAVTVSPVRPALGLRWDTSYLAVDGTLRVIPVNTNAIPITSGVSGGVLTLSWPADHIGWRLQNQTNSLSVGLTPSWFDVAGSTATNQVTLPINATSPTVFFRLVYP